MRPERFELPTYSSGGCRSIQTELRAQCVEFTTLSDPLQIGRPDHAGRSIIRPVSEARFRTSVSDHPKPLTFGISIRQPSRIAPAGNRDAADGCAGRGACRSWGTRGSCANAFPVRRSFRTRQRSFGSCTGLRTCEGFSGLAFRVFAGFASWSRNAEQGLTPLPSFARLGRTNASVPTCAVQPSTAAIEPFLRRFDCKTFLRSRSDFGVTSTNSSSAINSIACSRLRLR